MIGKHIGPYEVTGSLGRGGMGEVYRAHDDRLDRDVALKILPAEFARDEDRMARFEREARTLAVLKHQNIAAIFGIEQFEGQPVLVMELADGDDLSVRLGGERLAMDEVQKVARQLSAGLEYAHDQGIVHRDLKPANLKVDENLNLKILDFGLARAFEGAPGGSSLVPAADEAATMTQNLTAAGMVIGTAAYMSPEQTRGYAVDRRADIWSFGVILWEMLAGERLFAGETASDTMAAVLRKDPDWSVMPADAPPLLVQLCRRCLERDPQLRLRDIGEARIAMDSSGSSMMGLRTEEMPALAEPTIVRRPRRTPWFVAGAAVLAAAALGFLGFSGRLGPRPEPAPLVRSTVILEQGQGLYLNPGNPGAPVISPDGRHLAFTMQDTSGAIMIAVRSLASDEVRVVPGTANAAYLFWAPDSRSVGFFAGGQLNRVDTGGGPVIPICPTENAKSGSWSVNDEILFTPSHNAPIFKVAASGGEPVQVTRFESDRNVRSHRFPHWLPDGRHFTYLAWFRTGGSQAPETILRVAEADTAGLTRDLMPCQTAAEYADGSLIYVHEGNLMARGFSLANLDFDGPPRAITGDVLVLGAAHFGVFSVSQPGRLIYVSGGGAFGDARLAWVRDGERVTALDRARSLLGFAVSPDGSRIAASLVDDQLGSFDIWIHDVERALATRLTFASESEMSPIWSPDGRWIYYTADGGGTNVIQRIPSDGGGRPEVVVEMSDDVVVDDISDDGRLLSFMRMESAGTFSVWLKDLEEDSEPWCFREAPYSSGSSNISPDGRWMAYASDETGQVEVFVEAMEAGRGRWRISSAGGNMPEWAPDGSAVYYLDGAGRLQETEIVNTANGLAIGRTHAAVEGVSVLTMFATYAVNPANGELLVQVPAQENMSNRIELITNWQQLLSGEGSRP